MSESENANRHRTCLSCGQNPKEVAEAREEQANESEGAQAAACEARRRAQAAQAGRGAANSAA